ncbi:MAG TPA: homoserine kinase [Mycobacteriales bacterium]|nr:homoserine kinase [Mycobacteriales bacterium]
MKIRVPATSANLGPGFDALGLALALYDEIEFEVVSGRSSVEITGAGAGELPTDGRHLVLAAARAAFAACGAEPPALALRCTNRIPQQRGLGSSAAAIVAGIAIARALHPGALDETAAVQLAGRLEGHADNVAACLLGGLIVTWREGDADRAVRLDPAPDLQAVAFVPPDRSETAQMRGLLPESVSHRDATHNTGRAALLVHALTTRPDLLLPATEDRLHQPYRAPAMPAAATLVRELRDAGIAGLVSGAGPTVLALGSGATFAQSARDVASSGVSSGWKTIAVPVDTTGAGVTS